MATAKGHTVSSAPPHAVDEFVAPAKLNFDLDNPRFVEGQFVAEEDVVRHLVDEADVNELVQSILSAGYVDYEPLIVLKKDNTVLEGNRRLAAEAPAHAVRRTPSETDRQRGQLRTARNRSLGEVTHPTIVGVHSRGGDPVAPRCSRSGDVAQSPSW